MSTSQPSDHQRKNQQRRSGFVRVDAEVLREAKVVAATRGMTVGELFETALLEWAHRRHADMRRAARDA